MKPKEIIISFISLFKNVILFNIIFNVKNVTTGLAGYAYGHGPSA